MSTSKQLLNLFNTVKAKPNPIVVFGVGNYGTIASRNSIGARTVDYLANNLKMDWINFKDCSTMLSYSPENHLLLVKPDTYLVKDNFEVLSRIVRLMPNIKSNTFLAIHYEHLFKLGVVERIKGGRTKHNPGLAGITSVFQTEQYYRVSMGINHPIDQITFEQTLYSMGSVYGDLQTPFLLNRFPDVQLELVDKVVVPYAANEVLTAVLEMKQLSEDKKEIDEYNLYRFKSPRVERKNIEMA
ncbi:hypothetical protein SAMD00019534_032670 [Acytostelium subglobosum LB1]|uniref:hypothetical protein n=1 Tax=Acytostelium subglobosum LB1 TaxID=1410327 RepID=UPI00064485F8|nr:hypothetical protein SAMD00019534_032670 [Acytostelium subglobosum LB1]GAM20092.1 hypothetical protein SAMD00019534_032670 [Acytostelium subglobosum LB1]|eukprot:XP_012756854.1 hypothetical protein SAMD00019534_032670 [Acytostelium subglobosum LB1]